MSSLDTDITQVVKNTGDTVLASLIEVATALPSKLPPPCAMNRGTIDMLKIIDEEIVAKVKTGELILDRLHWEESYEGPYKSTITINVHRSMDLDFHKVVV